MRKIIALGLLLGMPAVSEAKSLEELLVEKGVISQNEAKAAVGSEAAKVYWKEGTVLEFPETGFSMKINTQLQTRYTYTDNDEDSGKDNTSSFSLRRARVILSGKALSNEFSYRLQADMVGTKDDSGAKTADLREGWIAWSPSDTSVLKLGQFKTGISRQEANSSTMLQFPDRSVASDFFAVSYADGVAGETKLADSAVLLSAGIFNGLSAGEGRNRDAVDDKHLGVFRVRYDAMGSMNAFEEGDLGNTQNAAVSLGATYAIGASENDLGAGSTDVDTDIMSIDASLKYQGWSLHTEYYHRNVEPDLGSENEPSGFYLQGGYFLEPGSIEVAARYSIIDCDDGQASGACADNDKLEELAASLNYYFWKHSLKAQLAYENIKSEGMDSQGDLTTGKWLFQLSSWF